MQKLIYPLIAFGLVAGCDRDTDEKPVVETRKTIEPDNTTTREVRVNTPRFDLEQERENLSRSIDERMRRLDARIDDLERKGDAKSKEMAATLRAKRDQARGKLSELGSRTEENWVAFKRDVSDTWDQLERDVEEAVR